MSSRTTRARRSALWERVRRNDDAAAREELIRRYLPLARSLARRYRASSESREDLEQVASVGLVSAIDRYDPDRGIPFRGFAAPTILGELRHHFRDKVWTVRVPRSLQERIAAVEKAGEELSSELGRPPSVGEIAAHIDDSETAVLEALEAAHNRWHLSFERPVGSDDEERRHAGRPTRIRRRPLRARRGPDGGARRAAEPRRSPA